METERRANKAFARAKQLWIWMVALAFSYVDLVTTVVVGLQYLNMGSVGGTRAAHVTFAMLGVSLGVQTVATHLTGMQLICQNIVCVRKYIYGVTAHVKTPPGHCLTHHLLSSQGKGRLPLSPRYLVQSRCGIPFTKSVGGCPSEV